VSYESGGAGEHFHDFMREYLLSNENAWLEAATASAASTLWLFDSCKAPIMARQAQLTHDGAHDGSRAALVNASLALAANFSRLRCGEMYGVYNNFFVTRVGFWHRPDVQHFLRHVDRQSFIYTHRWNDILWHSATLQTFLPRAQARLYDDFTYEHASTRDNPASPLQGCWYYGGISQGRTDASDALELASSFRARFCPDVEPCVQRYVAAKPDGGAVSLVSLTAGSVVVEHPDCSSVPAWYLCDPGNADAATAHHPGKKVFFRAHQCAEQV